MANIRTDLAVSPSFSRSCKTAASVNAQAMGQLKKELELASRKAARGRNESTLNASHAEILSRVLDSSITGVPPSFGSADVSREKDLCSSPREQTTWKLKSSPTKDSAIRLPRSIDWDLIAEEDESDAVLLGAGPSQEHIQLALTRPNLGLMDELGKKPNLRPSAAFLTPGRDSALSERSTLAPDSGRYDPKLQTIQRRSPAMTILDRSLLRKQGVFAELEVDEKDFLTADKLKFHQPTPKIERTTGRDKPVVSRSICLVGQAEQSACYGIKSAGQEAVIYETDIYWQKGGGSRKVPLVPEFSKGLPREKPIPLKKQILYSQPRIYKRSSHFAWTEKASGMKTVANMGNVAMLEKHLSRPARARETTQGRDIHQDYRDNSDKISSQGEFFDLAIKKPISDLSKTMPRSKDQAYIRASQLDKGGPDKDYDTDRARGASSYHVVPFGKLLPRRPNTEMSSYGKESPDVIYHPEKAWESFCTKRSVSPIKFEHHVSRIERQDGAESMLLGYPKADKPRKHQPGVNLGKSLGHLPPNTKRRDNVDTESDAAKIMSPSGRRATTLGYAWHPTDCDAKTLHIATPDISAGGKGRPNVAQKLVDKVYDTSKAWKVIDKRVHVPILGQGAEAGRGAAEYKVERQRLEGEIKTIINKMSQSH